jgi:hypothetical protein
MEKIKRPKKLNKGESSYQTKDSFQDNANKQFNTIYDKVDEIVEKIDSGFEGEPGPVGPPGPQRTKGKLLATICKQFRRYFVDR